MVFLTKVITISKFAFNASNNDELDFPKGVKIVLNQKGDDGWYEGTIQGKTGWFPSSYVSITETDETNEEWLDQCHGETFKFFRTSEVEYQKGLDQTFETYFKSDERLKEVFGNDVVKLVTIYDRLRDFSEQILGTLPNKDFEVGDERIILEYFLTEMAKYEELMVKYCEFHPLAVHLIKTSSQFASNEADVRAIISGLYYPIARSAMYIRFMQELFNAMPEHHPSRGNAQRCVAQLRKAQENWNNTKYRMDKVIEYAPTLDFDLETVKRARFVGAYTVENGDTEKNGIAAYIDQHLDLYEETAKGLVKNATIERREWNENIVAGKYTINLGKLELQLGAPCDVDAFLNAIQSDATSLKKITVERTSSSVGEQPKTSTTTRKSSTPSGDYADVLSSKHSSVGFVDLREASPGGVTTPSKNSGFKMNHELQMYVPEEEENQPPPAARMTTSTYTKHFFPLTLLTPYTYRGNKEPIVQLRKKQNISNRLDDDDDIELLKIVEGYCVETPQLRNSHSGPPQLIVADDEKILVEEMIGDEMIVQEKSIVDAVYSIRDQLTTLQHEFTQLGKTVESEQRARRRLEHSLQQSSKLASSDSGSLHHSNLSPTQ